MKRLAMVIASLTLLTGCGTNVSQANTVSQGKSTKTQTISHVTKHKAHPSKLAKPKVVKKQIQHTTLGLQIALAKLGYLPLTYSNNRFSWTYKNTPSSLVSLWSPGQDNVVTRGAVMTFEAKNNLAVDGVAGPHMWGAITHDLANNVRSPMPYVYIYVTKKRPEKLYVWEKGKMVYTSLANTGISASPTPDGTWPIYIRYTSQTMSGTNPNGSHYSDPGVPWVSYFYEGDAVHGFNRASYGWPQSLGCVELPPAHAKVVWGYTDYGTLVTVAG